MNKVLFITIGTRNYHSLALNCIRSIYKYWNSPNVNIDFLLLSDISYKKTRSEMDYNSILTSSFLHESFVPHLPWPLITLLRYKFFLETKDLISQYDYVFYIDADMEVVAPIGEEMLSKRVVVQHPGFWNKWGGPYSTDSRSEANVAHLYEELQIFQQAMINQSGENYTATKDWRYYQGCLQGGNSNEFLKMCDVLNTRINKDLSNNTIAVWHDESHMNKYMIENPPTKVLSPAYAFPETWTLPFDKIIIGKDKNNSEIRKEN